MSDSKWNWTLERRIRFRLRRAVRHRSGYLALSRLRRRPFMLLNGVKMVHTSVVSGDTDVVIEGPGRCGNTFAVVAFQLAQERPLNVAHHLHAEAQIIQGVETGVPVILLLRDPEDVAVSTSVSFGIPLKEVLQDYVTFYTRMLPYRDRVVVADFEQVTNDFGKVIESVNAEFGTTFKVFRHTQENVDRCFNVIDEFYQRTAPEPGRTVARPSKRRYSNKDALRLEYHQPQCADLRHQSQHLYDTFTSGC